MSIATDSDYPTTEEPLSDRTRNNNVLLIIGLVIVLGLGGGLGVKYWQYASTHESTDDAQLTNTVVQISPQVSGQVTSVPVTDDQDVKKGDTLVQIDDEPFKAAVEQAQANLDAAIAQARGAGVSVSLTSQTGNAQVEQARGQVDQADSAIAGARADTDRAAAAVDTASATAKGVTANVSTAEAGVVAAEANVARAKAGVTSANVQVDVARAAAEAAQAGVDAAHATAENARSDAKRYAELVSQGAVSAQVADRAKTAESTARAQEESAGKQFNAAQEQVKARQADVQAAQEQVKAAEAAVAQAHAQLIAAKEQAHAAVMGVKQARAQRESTQTGIAQAKARKTQALGQLAQASTVTHQVDVSRSNQAQALAHIAQAQAALKIARQQLQYTRIVAPCDGQVSKKSVEIGEVLIPEMPIMSVVPLDNTWVTANFKETQIHTMRPRQSVEIAVDAFPRHKFHGQVESIQAGTGATFAMLPADNATGNFTKVVQRIPVKIVLDPGQPDLTLLRAGMSVNVTVETK